MRLTGRIEELVAGLLTRVLKPGSWVEDGEELSSKEPVSCLQQLYDSFFCESTDLLSDFTFDRGREDLLHPFFKGRSWLSFFFFSFGRPFKRKIRMVPFYRHQMRLQLSGGGTSFPTAAGYVFSKGGCERK